MAGNEGHTEEIKKKQPRVRKKPREGEVCQRSQRSVNSLTSYKGGLGQTSQRYQVRSGSPTAY